jgi:hypothetical protein
VVEVQWKLPIFRDFDLSFATAILEAAPLLRRLSLVPTYAVLQPDALLMVRDQLVALETPVAPSLELRTAIAQCTNLRMLTVTAPEEPTLECWRPLCSLLTRLSVLLVPFQLFALAECTALKHLSLVFHVSPSFEATEFDLRLPALESVEIRVDGSNVHALQQRTLDICQSVAYSHKRLTTMHISDITNAPEYITRVAAFMSDIEVAGLHHLVLRFSFSPDNPCDNVVLNSAVKSTVWLHVRTVPY